MRNLIVVAGHAIPRDLEKLDSDEGWHLKSFQSGEGHFYVEHVRAGVELCSRDPEALLIFSGGQTDASAGARSEAEGYFQIAEHYAWWGNIEARDRVVVEEFALDSFLNLLYAVCRFYEHTRRYPDRITVAGWAFKKERFDAHRDALRFPASRFEYVGVNDPERLEEAQHFEALRRMDFDRDPYGTGEKLAAFREKRNPFQRAPEYVMSCPRMAGLLMHRGPALYDGPLPW